MHEEHNNSHQEIEKDREGQKNLLFFPIKNLYDLGGAVLIAFAFLVPIFFVPSLYLNFTTGKMLLLVVFVSATILLAVMFILKRGKAEIPFHPLFFVSLAVPVAYLVSGFFSVSGLPLSVAGYGPETYTFGVVLFFFALFFLTTFYFQKNNNVIYFYLALLASSAVLALFLLSRFIFGSDFLSFKFFNSLGSSPLESWPGVGILFGVIFLLAVFTLEMIKVKPAFRWVLGLVVLLSLFFLILTGIVWLWISIALVVLGFVIYQMTDKKLAREEMNIPILSVVTLFITLSFIFFGGPFSGMLSKTMGIEAMDIRPSFASTMEVAKNTLYYEGSLTRFLFGAGPVDFSYQWMKHKPDDIQGSRFWNVEFGQGVSYFGSMPITIGVVGVLTWVVFIVLFLFLIVRGLMRSFDDPLTRYIFVSSSAISILFLVTMTMTLLPVALLAIFFMFAAIPIGILVREKRIKTIPLELKVSNQNGSIYIIVAIVVSGMMVLFGMFLIQRAISAIFFEKAAFAFYREGSVESAEFNFEWATNLSLQDRFYRSASEFPLNNIRKRIPLWQSGDINEEDFLRTTGTDFREAISRAKVSTELKGTGYKNWLALGSVYQEMVLFNFTDIDPYTLAKEAYEKAIENNPKNPSLLLQMARLELLAGNLEEARQYNDKALEMKPNYANAVYFNSRLAIREGNLAEAKELIVKAINLEPYDPGLYFQLGILQYEDREFGKASDSLGVAVLLSPRFDNARYFLSLSLYQMGQTDDAVELMEDLATRYKKTEQLKMIADNMSNGESDPLEGVGAFEEPTPEMPIEEEIPQADPNEVIPPDNSTEEAETEEEIN